MCLIDKQMKEREQRYAINAKSMLKNQQRNALIVGLTLNFQKN